MFDLSSCEFFFLLLFCFIAFSLIVCKSPRHIFCILHLMKIIIIINHSIVLFFFSSMHNLFLLLFFVFLHFPLVCVLLNKRCAWVGDKFYSDPHHLCLIWRQNKPKSLALFLILFWFYILKKKITLIHSNLQIFLRYCYSPQGLAEFHPSQPGSVSLPPSTSQIRHLLLRLCRPSVDAHSSGHPWPVASRASPHRHNHHLTAPSLAVHQAHRPLQGCDRICSYSCHLLVAIVGKDDCCPYSCCSEKRCEKKKKFVRRRYKSFKFQ